MRFKKGSKVEVLCKEDVPYGVWQCGEIISDNGCTYTVRYDCHLGRSTGDIVDRVSIAAIRPCPPCVDGPDSWAAGDVVEVFDDLSWKTAAVLTVMSGNHYLVRLLGFLREFQLNKVDIRVRQLWQDGKWVVIGKGFGSCEDAKSNKLSILNCFKKKSSPMLQTDVKINAQSCLALDSNTHFQESYFASARTLKRASPFRPSDVEVHNGKAQKIRAIEKKGECQQMLSGYPSSSLKKVDAVAYPQECLGEMYIHASLTNETIGSYEMERGMPYCFIESFHARSLEATDSDIDACSVGSCSVVSNIPSKLSNRILAGNSSDEDILSSDAQSFNGHGDVEENCSLSLGEDVAERVHRLELHAYHCTLEALYASGPLTWEQEALLTNLRISLNISNDEHLMELRNLISAGTGICIS